MPKRSHTLKQGADRVIEERSDFDESERSGYASDTPVAGKKSRKQDTFGEAIPKKRKKKNKQEDASYKMISNSQTNIKAGGSAYDSAKTKVTIAKVYPGISDPRVKYYPTIRANAIPPHGVPYEDFQKTLASPSSKFVESVYSLDHQVEHAYQHNSAAKLRHQVMNQRKNTTPWMTTSKANARKQVTQPKNGVYTVPMARHINIVN
jgi:hypothetical protein